MDKLVIDFLNTKFPDTLNLSLVLVKEGMPALSCEIRYTDGSLIGRFIYYFETKKAFITSTHEIEDTLRKFFPISMSEVSRIFSEWVREKQPSIPDFSC